MLELYPETCWPFRTLLPRALFGCRKISCFVLARMRFSKASTDVPHGFEAKAPHTTSTTNLPEIQDIHHVTVQRIMCILPCRKSLLRSKDKQQ